MEAWRRPRNKINKYKWTENNASREVSKGLWKMPIPCEAPRCQKKRSIRPNERELVVWRSTGCFPRLPSTVGCFLGQKLKRITSGLPYDFWTVGYFQKGPSNLFIKSLLFTSFFLHDLSHSFRNRPVARPRPPRPPRWGPGRLPRYWWRPQGLWATPPSKRPRDKTPKKPTETKRQTLPTSYNVQFQTPKAKENPYSKVKT